VKPLCSGKATSITFSECVLVTLVIQHAKRMPPIRLLTWPARFCSIFHIIP